jgi:putative transposase
MTTATTMALTELAEKGADVDMLRQMVQFMARRLMELDVEARCGAGYDEKSPERINSRNGRSFGNSSASLPAAANSRGTAIPT